jgi:type I restriction enzyme, S subunit
MPTEFTTANLGDFIEFQRGFDLPQQKRAIGNHPIVSSSGITGYHSESMVASPGVVTGRYGTIGKVFYLDQPFWPLNTTLWVKNFKGNHPKFVYYFLHTLDFNSCADKSSVPGVNRNDLHSIPVKIPDIQTQQAIAEILSCLDNKIELNRQMNETLEDIAQALFKSWFVDFDPVKAKAEGRKPEGIDDAIAALFPSNFTESSLGLIPEGWDMAEIDKVADVIDCLHSKKPERTNEGRPFLQLNNIRVDGLMDITDMYLISDEDYKKWVSRIEAQEGDCVITNVGRVGAVAQIPRGLKAALGRNMTAIRTKSSFKYPTFLICYLCSDLAKNEITLKEDTGTILNALNVRNIPKLRFFKASKAIHDEFEKKARPIRSKMERNLAEINILANTRDLLLPRLLSGKLRVDEVSETVEVLIS